MTQENIKSLKQYSTDLRIVGEDLLRALSKLFYLRFESQVISEKTLNSKDFDSNLGENICEVLCENICCCISYKFSYKFAFTPFLSFCRKQTQVSNFQKVDGLVTKNVSVFGSRRVTLFKKSIFLYVIPVPNIISGSELVQKCPTYVAKTLRCKVLFFIHQIFVFKLIKRWQIFKTPG